MSRAGWFVIIGVVLYAITKGAEMALAVKPGVLLSTTWQVEVIRDVVGRVWTSHGLQATITSSMDGEHMDGSKHYEGLAEDYRTKDIPGNIKQTMFSEVRNILGSDYDVLFEYENQANEHLHIEYDPKF
jgi:hypothetical protein